MTFSLSVRPGVWTCLHELADETVEEAHELRAWELNLLLQLLHRLVLQPDTQQ